MKRILYTLILTFAFFYGSAQTAPTYVVKGTVQDTAGVPLTGTLIKAKWGQDSVQTSVDINGEFTLSRIGARTFTLSAAFLGFETDSRSHTIQNGNTLTVPPIILKTSTNTLNEVVVTAVTAIKIGEDTVTFSAASYPVRDGDSVDEMLRKLPGVKVDQDGNVTSQGEPITRIRVNGKDFFGGDVATAIKNLPAEVIKNLQFIDDYGDQANLTGIKTGEPEKILNLTIDEEKNRGYFVRLNGGLGNEDRYNTSIRGNVFRGEERVSFDGTINNTNMRGGGNGITETNSAGLSYQNEWNKKVSLDGGYSFNNRENTTIGRAYTQNFLTDFTRFEDETTNNNNENFNHNLSGNLELRPDSMNFIRFSPRLSFNNSQALNRGFSTTTQEDLLTLRDNSTETENSSTNLGANLFYNHKFAKRGRNMSLRGNFNYSNGDDFRGVLNDYTFTLAGVDSIVLQNQLIDNTNRNLQTSAYISYMEPIGRRDFLEASYNWSRSNTSTNRNTNDVISGVPVFNSDLSNRYEYQFVTNRFGLNYRFVEQKYNYTLGLNAQPAVLTGQNLSRNIDTRNTTFNIIPSARFVYRFSRQKSLQVNYWGRSNQPSFLQLQPITDNSNLQNIVTGNPNLNPEFIHSVNARYEQSDWNLGHILRANISYNQINDRIVTTKVLVPNSTVQTTSYTNTDGFYTLRGGYSYGKPFADRKFTITYGGDVALSNNVAFVSNEKNIAKNLNLRQELEFELDIQDVVDLELETSYAINTTNYSMADFDSRRTNSFQYRIRGRNYFFKDLTIGYNLSKTINSGFDNSIVRNPTILGAFAEYRFLKGNAGAIRLEAFDLLNQNTGISRDVFDNIIVDRQINRLGQYFMLSFNMMLRKFAGSGPAPRQNMGPGGRGPGGYPGPGGPRN